MSKCEAGPCSVVSCWTACSAEQSFSSRKVADLTAQDQDCTNSALQGHCKRPPPRLQNMTFTATAPIRNSCQVLTKHALAHWRSDDLSGQDTVWLHNLHVIVDYLGDFNARGTNIYFSPNFNASIWLTNMVLQGTNDMLAVQPPNLGQQSAYMAGARSAV